MPPFPALRARSVLLSMLRLLRLDGRQWRLRTGLLAPIVLVVPLFLAVTALLWEDVARREADRLVAQRQETALAGLSARLQERRQTHETIAYLLAHREGLGALVESSNVARLAQTLIVMQATLNVGHINVYRSNGERLLHIGGAGSQGVDGRLVIDALLGHDSSELGAGEAGVVVSAAAVVSGTSQTAGVVVVGTTVPAETLRNSPAAEDVAVFASGRLIDTSLVRPDVLEAIKAPITSVEDVDALNIGLEPLHVRAAGLALTPTNVVVAMVPLDDLDRASKQRTLVIVGGTLALLSALILITVVQARAIARPLENLLVVAGALMRGEYRRVPPSRNRELHALGLAVNHLANELEHKLAELTHQATHDSLSGLPTRTLFLQTLQDALRQSNGLGVAVLFLDLDSFKIVNDSLGHAAGDQLIVGVIDRLRGFLERETRFRSTIARLGGDEFTILLHGGVDELSVRHTAEQLATLMGPPFKIGGYELVVSASIGVAHSTVELHSPEQLLRAADVAMYRAKAIGRGKFVVYERAMGEVAAQRLDRETALRQAIETGALRVHYQPIVDLASGVVREVEALVRWHHPELGLVPPADFIPLAEESGLILPLGRWVLEQACRQLQRWQAADPAASALTLNVNLSARQLREPNLTLVVREILQRTSVDPARLTLEITESCLMQDGEVAQLRALARLGVNLAIDDFGTGYSSLARLSQLPIGTLKIDKSFVSHLGLEPENDAVVQTIIALAHSLRMSVTAEGIEQPAQAARLLALGCTRGQGYYFGRPAPANELALFAAPRLARAA